MRRVVKFIFDFFEVHVGAIIFALLLTSVFLEVFFRYVLNAPSPQLFELSIYSYVWVIYLGAALATRYNQHMRFDLLYRNLPQRIQSVLDTFFDFLTAVVFLYVLFPSIGYTIELFKIKASALRIPWSFLLMVFPIFLILVIAHNFIRIRKNILRLLGKEVKEAEVSFPWL